MRQSEQALPKPLVEIGGQPILWHVMALYASQGLSRFVLLLGNGAERIERFASMLPTEWSIECVDTGVDTPTGGRVALAADRVGDETFCLTYADGLADLDLGSSVAFTATTRGPSR